MSSQITKKTISGTNWSFVKTLGQNSIAFVSGIVLARLLLPEDFGLLAIAMIFIQFGNVFANFGITQAVIQQKNINTNIISAGFTLSLVFGSFLFVLIWFLAPFIADFFSESRVTEIIRTVSVIFLMNAFIGVTRGSMMRHFRYKEIFYIEMAGYGLGFGGTGIVLAVMGFGVWSLVWGVIAQHVIIMLGYVFLAKLKFWRIFSSSGYKKLISFGGGISLSGVFQYLSETIDNIIIARILNATQLGLYSKAYGLMQIPARNISHTISNISMSAFSSIQDSPEKLQQAYFKAINLIFLVAGPLFVIMVISAEYLIVGLYGNQWTGAVQAFQILSIALAFKAFFGISGSLAKATGYVYAESIRQMLLVISLGTLAWLLIDYGIEGVSWAVVGASFFYFLLISQLALKITNGRWVDFIQQFKGGFWLALCAGAVNITVILLIEFLLPEIAMPLKLGIILIFTGFFMLILFFILPAALLGPQRDWLIATYSAKIPGRFKIFSKKNT